MAKRKVEKLSPQYLAGLFDGEGCVNFTIRGKSRQLIIRVTIVNTNEDILNMLYCKFGGMLCQSQNKKHPEWKIFRSITWRANTAEEFLKIIEPYSIIKANQIKLALEYFNFKRNKDGRYIEKLIPRKDNSKCLRFYKKLAPEIKVKELEYKNAMHELNRKGREVN
jgi:hypothetical protein